MAIGGTISASSARSRVKNFRRARTAVLAEESTQSWKSVDCFPAPAARPPLSSDSAVETPFLFVGRSSLTIERSAATGGTSTTTLPNTVYTYDLGGRLSSTFDSATGITTTYTYKPNTNYVQTETSVTSASSVVNSVVSACLLKRSSQL